MLIKSLTLLTLLITTLSVSAIEYNPDPGLKKKKPEYLYSYREREHTFNESAKHVAGIYGVSWVLYPLTQLDTFRNDGSWENYKNNFGKIVFDKDEPFWNFIVHPLSGSQMYLYYRANGYDKMDSLAMTFISSALFEFTVEIYTEPASVQDLYQTPVFGSVLGLGFETLSMYLLNSGNSFGKVFGHIINPSTLFWYYEGRMQVTPFITNDHVSVTLRWSF